MYKILEELKDLGVKYESTGSEEWVTALCPFHNDNNPSLSVNTEKGYYKCHACGAGGPFEKLVGKIKRIDKQEAESYLKTKYSTEPKDKLIEPSVVEACHDRIREAPELVKELNSRGVYDTEIRAYRLGEDKGCITIPITNALGQYVNLIRYDPGAVKYKFTNAPGRGLPSRLYPIDQISYPRILLTGGPVKAIAAIATLNKHGIGVLSSTGGEQLDNWPKDLASRLKDKEWVGICLDIDETGVLASLGLAQLLHPVVNSVSIIDLPLDRDKYPKGDLSDFLGKEQGDIKSLIDISTLWEPPILSRDSETNEPPRDICISQATETEYTNKRVNFKSLISAIEPEVFYVPRKVSVRCNKDQKNCSYCPIYTATHDSLEEINAEDPAILSIIGSSQKALPEAIKQALNIPACKAVSFQTVEHYKVQHSLLSRDLDSSTATKETIIPSVAVNCELQISETYKVTGRVVPHPDTQKATAIVSGHTAVSDTLTNYTLEPDKLKLFQPEDWTMQGIERKLEHLYTDLEKHATGIYRRRDMHLLCDLAYHSVLLFVDPASHGKRVKGWVEVCIVGDSAVGKTQTVEGLQNYYGLGTKVDCKNATVAGLLGGVQQINGRYFVSWGVLPTHDRRIVTLEELKGAHPEVVAKLTETRSSGIAQIPKIEYRQAHCRVRLIALSNPPSGSQVSAYAYGTQIIQELLPNAEDIRRFDAFMVPDQGEVDIDVGHYSQSVHDSNGKPAIYSQEACRSLVLWSWTRASDQIVFEDWRTVVKEASRLCDQFTPTIPIVDSGSMRFKLAKLAIALAVRTFSHVDGDPETVLVRTCHVRYIAAYLVRVYSTRAFGYNRLTEAANREQEITPQAKQRLVNCINDMPFAEDFIKLMQGNPQFDVTDICDWCSYDRHEARELISLLTRSGAIAREKGRFSGYRKTPAFVELLDKLEVVRPTKPGYLQGDM